LADVNVKRPGITDMESFLSGLPAPHSRSGERVSGGRAVARRRMIDPRIWESEQFSKLSHFERLLYIGLISNADDEGRLRDHPSWIRSVVFPYDDVKIVDIESALSSLLRSNLIFRYQTPEWNIIQHPKWEKYQTVNRPQDSKFPAYDHEIHQSVNESVNESVNAHVPKEVRLKEVKGKECPNFDEASDEFLLARYLRKKILSHNPLRRLPPDDPGKLVKWCRDFDKMIRIDHIEADDIAAMIDWIFDGESKQSQFWRGNILSPAKLRAQYPTLFEQSGMLDDLKKVWR